MTPIMQRALGDRFADLHPRIREQYAITSESGEAWVGRGVMEEIWRGSRFVPFLMLGATRRVMFAERGRDVPFEIANYAYLDGVGRETLTWCREFLFPTPRRFDETLIYSERRGRAVVYAGTHQHLAVELELGVEDGALVLRTGVQRLYEWGIGIRIPRLFSGVAEVTERYDDEAGRFAVDVAITNPVWGRIFGYRGWFTLEKIACSAEEILADVRPVREERRE